MHTATKITVTVPLEIDAELIANALSAADIGYWAVVVKGADQLANVVGTDYAIVREHNESDRTEDYGPERAMTSESIKNALVLIATKWPWHFQDILADNADSETGDVLVQVATLGDIVYG